MVMSRLNGVCGHTHRCLLSNTGEVTAYATFFTIAHGLRCATYV